jgi:CheY-like chemotaxis protein
MTPGWTILFVDDDRDFLDAQAAYFGSRGHVVHTVENSQDALEFLRTTIPDILFLDLMMERYDSGFRLAHQIRKDERLTGMPIVMLSVSTRRGRACCPGPASTGSWTNRRPASSCSA